MSILPLDELAETSDSNWDLITDQTRLKTIGYNNNPMGTGVYFQVQTQSNPIAGRHITYVRSRGKAKIVHMPSPSMIIDGKTKEVNQRTLNEAIKKGIITEKELLKNDMGILSTTEDPYYNSLTLFCDIEYN